MNNAKLQELLANHMQAYIESTPLSLFDEIIDQIYQQRWAARNCHLVISVKALEKLSLSEVYQLGDAFKTLTWRDVPGIAFAIVEVGK